MQCRGQAGSVWAHGTWDFSGGCFLEKLLVAERDFLALQMLPSLQVLPALQVLPSLQVPPSLPCKCSPPCRCSLPCPAGAPLPAGAPFPADSPFSSLQVSGSGGLGDLRVLQPVLRPRLPPFSRPVEVALSDIRSRRAVVAAWASGAGRGPRLLDSLTRAGVAVAAASGGACGDYFLTTVCRYNCILVTQEFMLRK